MRHLFLYIFFSPLLVLSQATLVSVRGNYLYMASTEVSNEDYRTFLAQTRIKDKHSLMPNSTVWLNNNSFNEPYAKYYFHHPAYNDYPVVGISQKQASAYCEWMEDKLNKDDTTRVVVVRLPTESEWEYAANCAHKYPHYPWHGKSMRDEKGKLRANFVLSKGDYMGLTPNSGDGADITAPVISYYPNDFGLYNMSGNVEEMVEEIGLAKGGSWKDRADRLEIRTRKYYEEPTNTIGFRYVVEVIQQQKQPNKIRLNKRYLKKIFTKINDTLFVGKTEVTNELYHLFVNEKGTTYLPNCYGWDNLFPFSRYYANNYYSFMQYPVVNITQMQAKEFCQWLTQKYVQAFGEEYTIKLPSAEERLLFAMPEQGKYPWGGDDLRDNKNNYQANFNAKLMEDFGAQLTSNFTDMHDYDGYAISNPVKAFKAHQKLYGTSGNVAEFLDEEDYITGGSWMEGSSSLEVQNISVIKKGAYAPSIGFRIILIKKDR